MISDSEKIRLWCEQKGGESYDPNDIYSRQPFLFLSSRHENFFARTLLRPLQIINLLMPIATRKILGIHPSREGANFVHMAHGYLRRAERNFEKAASLKKAREYVLQLLEVRKKRFGAWGSAVAIPYENGRVWPAELPLAHLTCRAIHLLIDYQEVSGSAEFEDDWKNLYVFFEEGLIWRKFPDGRTYCSYSPDFESWVYNIFADVAAVLHRMDQKTKSARSREKVEGLLKTLIQEASPDHRWPYLADGKSDRNRPQTYDSYHTAFILSALAQIVSSDFDKGFLSKCVERYLDDFFDPHSFKPLTSIDGSQTINIANWPESVRAFSIISSFNWVDPTLVNRWEKIIYASYEWIRKNLKYDDGHFAHSLRWNFVRHDLKSLRWGNALVWEALESLQTFEAKK